MKELPVPGGSGNAKKAPAKKVPAKKAAAKKAAAGRNPTAQTAGREGTSPRRRPALAAPPTDPLVVLGLVKPFSEQQLRQAWRRYAATHHPDAGGDPGTFSRGRHAYEALRRNK